MKTFEEFTMLTPANHIPEPEQGKWNYDSYATLPIRRKYISFFRYLSW